MKEWLLIQLIPSVIKLLLKYANSEVVRKYVDKGFDLIEEFVEDSETKIGDVIVLPIMAELREAFNIPDNDE